MPAEDEEFQGADHPEGKYANYFKVGHNEIEFLIDCGQFYAEREPVQFHTRIVTSPIYAKALFETLRDSLDQYEECFGVIENGA